jgi:hypothetical protein
MAAALFAVSLPGVMGDWIRSHVAARLAVLVAVGAVTYTLAACVLGIDELGAVLHGGTGELDREDSPETTE